MDIDHKSDSGDQPYAGAVSPDDDIWVGQAINCRVLSKAFENGAKMHV